MREMALQQEKGLRYRAEIDSQTGLWNKETTERIIASFLEEHPEENHAFLIITIDNFAALAETEGRMVEERVLSIVSEVLEDHFRHTDLVGRVSASDFVVLITHVPDEKSVRKKIAAITNTIKRDKSYALPVRLSLSVGFTMSNGKGTTYEDMYRQAEAALNKVRQLQKGRINEYKKPIPELENDYCGSDRTVLVVEDDLLNRRILADSLKEEYHVLEAKNGQEAYDILTHGFGDVDGIILDWEMPVMDGREFLKIIQKDEQYKKIPIIIATAHSDADIESKALQLGVWDFVIKPYHMEVLKQRLKNAIIHSQLTAFNQLRYLAEYDQMTGIYNKNKLFEMTRDLLFAYPEDDFVFIRMDIENFKLVNAYFGSSEGDRLLRRIGEACRNYARKHSKMTYGYMQSDVFCFCVPFVSKEETNRRLEQTKLDFEKICENFKIIPKFGLYVITDKEMSIDEIYDHSIMAARRSKKNYICTYAYYEERMMEDLTRESEIAREMLPALESGQFIVYYQPKYETKTNLPNGAEALVRWKHPTKGMISPGEFIPVFEKNGFITRVDYFVWEEVCKFLHSWKEKGWPLMPVSVNVSRMNMYNPMLVEQLKELVERYEIPVEMLNLEITETAYTENPVVMHQAIEELRELGFIVLMDDFGSGYSSLNMLKDLPMDILKIDMKFLPEEMTARAERILASIVRMAKWLDMQVVVEGVEKTEQVQFLQKVGADYIQGYYYAKPMPREEYEDLVQRGLPSPLEPKKEKNEDGPEGLEELWQAIPYASMVFDGLQQPVGLYRYSENQMELLRANTAFAKMFGYDEMTQHEALERIERDQRYNILAAFDNALTYQEETQCVYQQRNRMNQMVWIQLKLKYAGVVRGENIFVGIFSDITKEKQTEEELERFQSALRKQNDHPAYILVADDQALNRIILKDLFEDKYEILEGQNGEEAFELLKKYGQEIAIVLLDLEMPVMSGEEFLLKKKEEKELEDIPVIVISGNTSFESQQKSLELGVNDYITKPFVADIVRRRVKNVLDYSRRFSELVQEYQSIKQTEEQ